MCTLKFRNLRPEEIEVRFDKIRPLGQNGCHSAKVMLYRDATGCQRVLDETVGPMRWQRSHQIIDGKNYCTISIWDEETKQWVSKQDVGVEGNFEKEKAEASDAFKRACANWGIGRELYSVRNANVELTPSEIYKKGDFFYANPWVKMYVESIVTDEDSKRVLALRIVDNENLIRYTSPGYQDVIKEMKKDV